MPELPNDPRFKSLATPLCDRLGMAVPIVQAPIGNVCTPELVCAVADAGGLGMLPVGGYEPSDIPAVLARVAELTPGPVGLTVNIRRDQTERVRACLDAGAGIMH